MYVLILQVLFIEINNNHFNNNTMTNPAIIISICIIIVFMKLIILLLQIPINDDEISVNVHNTIRILACRLNNNIYAVDNIYLYRIKCTMFTYLGYALRLRYSCIINIENFKITFLLLN